MDETFWIGLAAGAVLSFAASIAANLTQPNIAAYLDKRKLVSREKRKGRALLLHHTITEIQQGKRDRYLYMMQLNGLVIFFGVIALVSLLNAIAILALTEVSPDRMSWDDPNLRTRLISVIMLVFFGLVDAYLFRRNTERYRSIASALEDYDKYLVEFNQQWPSEANKANGL